LRVFEQLGVASWKMGKLIAVLYSPPQIPVDSTGLQWTQRDSSELIYIILFNT